MICSEEIGDSVTVAKLIHKLDSLSNSYVKKPVTKHRHLNITNETSTVSGY